MNQQFLYNLAIAFAAVSGFRVLLFLWLRLQYALVSETSHQLLAMTGKKYIVPKIHLVWLLVLIVSLCYLFSV